MRSAKIFVVFIIVVTMVFAGSVCALAAEQKNTEKETTSQKTDEEVKKELKKLDINSATLKELQTLSGIGPKIGQAIIDARPFKKVEDLLAVKGIGEKKLAKIQNFIEVKPVEKIEKAEKKQEQ